MSQRVDGGTRDFVAGGAIAQYLRVRLSGGKLAAAGATDTDWIGVLRDAAFADLDRRTVYLRSKEGTVPMVASEAVTQYAAVYAAAGGKVATSGTILLGLALQAASGNNSIIEVLESPQALLGVAGNGNMRVPLTNGRVHDAVQTLLPTSAGTDDLGLVDGSYGTGLSELRGSDFGGTTVDQYARYLLPLHTDYVNAGAISIVLRAGMLTTVSDGTATVDVVCHAITAAGVTSADICATAAQSINSLTLAAKTFSITPTDRVPGDLLDVKVRVQGSDTGNAGVMIPVIQALTLRYAFYL